MIRKSSHEWMVVLDAKPSDQDVLAYCNETFGPGGRNKKYRWRVGWLSDQTRLYFRNATDALAFSLRFE